MADWWNGLTTLEMIYWLISIISSIFFLILLIMTFIGADSDVGDVDADMEADTGIGFQFFTLKNMAGFFTIFGWSGLAMVDGGNSTGISLLVSFICGILMMVIMASIFYLMSKMVASGTLKINNAIGKVGDVYLPIQKERENIGQIQITVQGSLRTLQALTDEKEDLSQGTVVEVIQVIGEDILLVKKITK